MTLLRRCAPSYDRRLLLLRLPLAHRRPSSYPPDAVSRLCERMDTLDT